MDLKQLDASNAFLVFRRGDGIDTYYKINSVSVFVDEATVGKVIEANSGIELVGFARSQDISTNIFDFAQPIPVSQPDIPVVISPSPTYTASDKLNIPGYDEVSDIYLADGSVKVKSADRLNIQLATHSISLGEDLGDKRSNVDYTITDQTGKVWVSVNQKQTTIEGRLGGRFGNNHPDRQYIAGLTEDCNVFLPLENTYTVKAHNKGNMVVDFWIMHPWSADGTERKLYRRDLGTGNEDSFTFNANDLKSMEDYKRTIKININGVKR